MKLTKQLKKGITVKIIAGKDKGKTGKVISIDKEKNKVLVEGVNQFKKHQRPSKQGEKGQTITVDRPLNISNVKVTK
ncbi:MAG: 50S ribosomal protein L24 [Candidatus Harrisonbacteria bacterium CG10_big_fil_rev_8_21_14_0_10_38_8]|uniref:Large ribosomal subunit protein uL24 n=1 Tax=Candidatus Harrisonbacteria bacterium CG10_big_fil_rev_8_21_14_0_10_38_8 TaxID=1974582 RepID=A0A2M6WK83_9BACT|nr:MAG: 50S ribosomal protein L24 [Candidatus Harrisonbacteria bacterium CG10_big_fil_rev_8_21_14_0_10_38_8]